MKKKYRQRHIILGENIRYLRKIYGYTQQSLADKMGIERSTLAKIETAESSARLDTIFVLMEIFDVPVNVLLGCEKW